MSFETNKSHGLCEPGQKYNRLTAVAFSHFHRTAQGQVKRHWCFKCDCGKEITAELSNVRGNHTTSCGCALAEIMPTVNFKHGDARVGKITFLFSVWRQMLGRCHNPNLNSYKYYGGRGIKVCERWSEYVNFKSDMEPGYKVGLQLDRINNDGNYEPGNCRWATRREQSRNRRSNVWLTFRGRTQILKDWADEIGVSYTAIQYRIEHGWSVERALTEPPHNRKRGIAA